MQRRSKRPLRPNCAPSGLRDAERTLREPVRQHYEGVQLPLVGGLLEKAPAQCRPSRPAFALNEHEAVLEATAPVRLQGGATIPLSSTPKVGWC